jgi:hypothetical protein
MITAYTVAAFVRSRGTMYGLMNITDRVDQKC